MTLPLTKKSLTLDADDDRSINEAIATYQATHRWKDEQGGVLLPEGESCIAGAILGEICRDWLDQWRRA